MQRSKKPNAFIQTKRAIASKDWSPVVNGDSFSFHRSIARYLIWLIVTRPRNKRLIKRWFARASFSLIIAISFPSRGRGRERKKRKEKPRVSLIGHCQQLVRWTDITILWTWKEIYNSRETRSDGAHVAPTPVQLSLGLISSCYFWCSRMEENLFSNGFFFVSVRKWNKMIYALLWRKYLLRRVEIWYSMKNDFKR